jgi:hypothetical protein
MNYEVGIKKQGRIFGIQDGAVRKPRPGSCFAPYALGGFAFNSGAKNQTPSHRVAVSRSQSQSSWERLPPQRLRTGSIRPPVRLARRGVRGESGQTRSKSVKPLVGQAGASNPCKYLKMNSLQNKQPLSGQTMLNLVKHGQNKPIRFGFK